MGSRIVILSGPSGVGKDTLIDAWRKINPSVERVVAVTTRSPRSGEVEGVDYRFVSRERFDELASTGAFLEYKEVHGNGYATPLESVQRLLEDGKVAVLKIDVQGALAVMEARNDVLTVFVLPPDEKVLEERLQGRGTDDEATVRRRLEGAKAELAQAHRYQFRIVNDSVDRVVQELEDIVRGRHEA